MKIKTAVTIGDRLDGATILPVFSYDYTCNEFYFKVQTDNEDDDRAFIKYSPDHDDDSIKVHEFDIPNSVNDVDFLGWIYNEKAGINTAKSLICRSDENGLCTHFIKIDSGYIIRNTELPAGFPEPRIVGYQTFEAEVPDDDKKVLNYCKPVECKDITDTVFTFTEEIGCNGKALRSAKMAEDTCPSNPDKITFTVPKFNIEIGDTVKFSHKGNNFETVVTKLTQLIATSKYPAEIGITLVDKETKKSFEVMSSNYRKLQAILM